MADFVKTKPLFYDEMQKVHRSMSEGQVVDPALLPISTDSGNELKFGTDGGMYVKGVTASDMVSAETPNFIQMDREGKLKVDGNSVLSNGGVNLLTIDPVDGRVILTKEDVIAALERASHDEGNLIVPGTDGGCYLSVDNLLGKNNDILHGDDAGKLVADLSLKYNFGTGKLDIIGYDGTTVVSSVTVPTTTSSLRGAYLSDGKPSVSGEDIIGDYFISIAMQYDGLYDRGAPLKFHTHKSAASKVEFEYIVDEEHSGMWPSSIKASFLGDNKVAEVSQERATAIAFSDGSVLHITWTGISGTRISGTVTFTPAVGLESGSYIRMVYLLDNGDVADVYVDVTSLVDVYVQGNGITISDHIVSVKTKPDGGITVDSAGVGIKADPTGGIAVGSAGVGIKADPNGGLKTSSNGASVKTDPDGGLITGPDGAGIDSGWLKQQVAEYETKYAGGNGISITDTSDKTRTITAVATPRGGLVVTDTGIGVNLADGGDSPSGLEITAVGTLGVKKGDGIGISSEGVSVRAGDGLTFNGGGKLIVDDTVLRTNKEQTITATKTFDTGYFGKTVAVNAMDIKPVDGAVFTKTVTANTTFTISGTPSNVAACFTLVLTNGGSHTVTWPSSVKWTEGTPPELIAAGIDVITFITPNGGTTWYGCHSVQGVPA